MYDLYFSNETDNECNNNNMYYYYCVYLCINNCATAVLSKKKKKNTHNIMRSNPEDQSMILFDGMMPIRMIRDKYRRK
jgi:hypothetical protein